MSTIATTFIYFDTYNYTNTQSTSSYALPFAGFSFRPILDTSVKDKYSIKRIIWNFGDDTITEAVTATHTYDQPGSYKVTCAVYDSEGNASIYVEQDKEFGGLELTIDEYFSGHKDLRVPLSLEVAESIAKAILEVVDKTKKDSK